MKLTTQNPLSASTALINVIEKKHTMPILAHAHLEAADGQLTLTGSDLETEIRYTIPDIEIAQPGAVCIEGRKLHDFCKIVGDGAAIKIETMDAARCKLQARSRATFNTLPADEYPKMEPDENQSATFNLDAAAFIDRLSAIEHCMANQDVRFYLNGMLFNLENGQLQMVASDGHRLGRASMEVESDQALRCIVPRKAVQNIVKLFKTGSLELTLGPGQIRIRDSAITLTSKTIDHRYPEFNKVDQDPRPYTAAITSEALASAIAAGKLNSDEKNQGIQIVFGPDKITATGHNRDGEESSAETDELDYTGEPVTMAFNAQYPLEALSKTTGQIEIHIAENLSHIEIVPRDRPATWIIMPMRI